MMYGKIETKGYMADSIVRHVQIWDWMLAFLDIIAIACFALPMLIANYGGSLYYVMGFDMIFGRMVPTDKYGMIPQLQILVAFVALTLSVASLLVQNRAKSVFLSALLNFIALFASILMLFNRDADVAKFDPIVGAVRSGNIQFGFFALLIVLAIVCALSIFRAYKCQELRKDIKYSYWLYILALPIVTYALVFYYYPMYGVIIGFKDFNPRLGILGSSWVGFKHFISFFDSYYFWRLITNTVLINVYDLIFGFTAPIIFALLLNEIRSNVFKRSIQTITYLPHFVSLVVVCGLIIDFLSGDGLVNNVLRNLGIDESKLKNYMMDSKYFRSVFVGSGIWQGIGWGSIIYLAALSSINMELYEAAIIDGASRWQRMIHITLPGLAPTIIILFILRIGRLMNVGFEKIILLYNPSTYETADVISSFVYRRGLQEMDYSFSAAVGLFNSVISFILLIIANKISRTVSETSLW